MAKWLIWLCWVVFFGIAPTGLVYLLGFFYRGAVWPPAEEVVGGGQLLLTSVGLLGFAARELAIRDEDVLVQTRFALISVCFVVMFVLGGIYGAIYAAGLENPATPGLPFIDLPKTPIAIFSAIAYGTCFLISGAVSLWPTAKPIDATPAEV